MATPPFDDPPTDNPGPAETKIRQAMAFYSAALKDGPRKASEVLAEGKRRGHSQRTQERARSRLHVRKIPPTTWQGPWLVALPDDPAVKADEQRRKEKGRKRQERKGNGRKRRKQNDEGVRKRRSEQLASAR